MDGARSQEIPFDKLRAGSRPAGENAGLRDDAVFLAVAVIWGGLGDEVLGGIQEL